MVTGPAPHGFPTGPVTTYVDVPPPPPEGPCIVMRLTATYDRNHPKDHWSVRMPSLTRIKPVAIPEMGHELCGLYTVYSIEAGADE